ncbi:putative PTS system glucosamine-specific EIICBA component [Paenibacillus glycanilyticus]|uniref:PTS system glucosamine-specific EIICBA component n=1 Tax=Paenibacillus glycanilyticus TaxID=126569 RepID=A0ABQ6NDI2_9BACL|nr:glucose PTS transporter subunit IIA [Paenibacillus glycanilyticus]GMK43070.1 putative PTS system glucosamine-specific EIICBA component [Paenibacillus glycanilyticus]
MNFLGRFQQLGRAFMLPMIVLPAAAIFLFLSQLPWDLLGIPDTADYLQAAGHAIFKFLPYIFALGVSLGLTGNALAAGMAALAGMVIYVGVTGTADPQIEPTVFVGSIIGMISGFSYERFKNLRLPEYIQFFGGPRFVPLFVSVVTVILSMAMIGVAPLIQRMLEGLGDIVASGGGFGVFLFGFLYRILVVFGLHHLLSHVFWFQVGGYETADGSMVYGDLPRFFAGDPTAGAFMAGMYPIVMFALPAIAFAIIHEAREDLKPKIRKTFLYASLASFLTGVTEPVEFAFLFVAPYLFVVHAILSGIIMWVTYELGIRHGFSFSGGVIDYIINEHLATRGWLLIPIGIVVGLVYYLVFRWAINRFRIPTPGREEGSQLDEWAGDIPYRAPLILQAIGGKDNIVQMESCITRLRLKVSNEKLLDNNALRNLGAAGVLRLGGGNVQVVFGTYSELIRAEMLKAIQRDQEQVLFSSPVQGRMIPLEDVPDPIFAGKLVGQGVAFIPEKGELVSPVKGTVMIVYPTMHAVGIRTQEGLEVLLHIGIDTSKLTGKSYFKAVVEEGQEVMPGDMLVRFDLQRVRKESKSLATPMVITNSDLVHSWRFAPFKAVKKGQSSVLSVVLKERNGGGEKP